MIKIVYQKLIPQELVESYFPEIYFAEFTPNIKMSPQSMSTFH